MKCSEFKENVAAFALDALTENERRACEAHLAEPGPHEGCESELRQAYETTALIGASLPSERLRSGRGPVSVRHDRLYLRRSSLRPCDGDDSSTDRPPTFNIVLRTNTPVVDNAISVS